MGGRQENSRSSVMGWGECCTTCSTKERAILLKVSGLTCWRYGQDYSMVGATSGGKGGWMMALNRDNCELLGEE
jgi:hypothetical protein